MIQPFPLYDSLEEARKKYSPVELRKLCYTISKLSEEHTEIIYALILHHEMKETNGTRFRTIPYNGKVFDGGKGIIYNMTILPPVLQQIISTYMERISQ